jgi:succinyl-diaminopimelate desuccinylase
MRELFGEYEIAIVDHAAGARPGLDAELATEFLAAVGGTARPKYGWTDVARFSELGVPAVNYGPGDPLTAHADDERVRLDEILACENGLRSWLTRD